MTRDHLARRFSLVWPRPENAPLWTYEARGNTEVDGVGLGLEDSEPALKKGDATPR
jgi:hypothetical protein